MNTLVLLLILSNSFVCCNYGWWNEFKADRALDTADYDGADKYLNQVLINKPIDARVLYNKGNLAYNNKKFEQAHAYFDQACQHTQDNTLKLAASYQRANSSAKQEHYQKALDEFKLVVSLDENHACAHKMIKQLQQLLSQQKNNQNQSQDKQKDQSKDNTKPEQQNRQQKEKDSESSKDPNQASDQHNDSDKNDSKRSNSEEPDQTQNKNNMSNKANQQQKGATSAKDDQQKSDKHKPNIDNNNDFKQPGNESKQHNQKHQEQQKMGQSHEHADRPDNNKDTQNSGSKESKPDNTTTNNTPIDSTSQAAQSTHNENKSAQLAKNHTDQKQTLPTDQQTCQQTEQHYQAHSALLDYAQKADEQAQKILLRQHVSNHQQENNDNNW